MKVDLEELVLTARAATPGPWWMNENDGSLCSGPEGTGAWEVGAVDMNDNNIAHVIASSPHVVIALVARIRELEGALEYTLDGQGAAWTNRLHDLLAKGVVLP